MSETPHTQPASPLRLFDTHTHLDDPRFEEDLDAVLNRMGEAGVELCLIAGEATGNGARAVELAQRCDAIYAAMGVHPHVASQYTPALADQLMAWLHQPRVMALGEIGLDYYYDHSPRDVQRRVFDEQLDMAYALDKPVILHIRDAHGEALDMLRARAASGRMPRGVAHCYSGSLESAREYLDLGMYISLAGPVTFKNARALPEVAKGIPLDYLMIETDCPYLSPEPMRGRRNEPANVAHVARRVAELRGMDAGELALKAYQNGMKLFGIGG